MSANASEKSKTQGSTPAKVPDGRDAHKEPVNYDYTFQNQMGYAPPMNEYYGYNQMQQYSYFGDSWSNGASGDVFVNYGQGGPQDYAAAGGQQGFAGYGYPVDQFSNWGYSNDSYQYFGSGQAVGSARGARGYETGEYYSEEQVAAAQPVSSAQDYQRSNNGDIDSGVSQIEQGIKGVALGDKESDSSYSGAKKSWATIASQPARSMPHAAPAPKGRGRGPQPMNTLDSKPRGRGGWSGRGRGAPAGPYAPNKSLADVTPAPEKSSAREETPYAPEEKSHPILDDLKSKNDYNPTTFTLKTEGARFFVIKSYSEDDIHRSIKLDMWCSTEHGNKRLDAAFRERSDKGPIYLFYSVNGSGHFCGVASMESNVDYDSSGPTVWAQDKWKGRFSVKWIYVKDVPNSRLRHIRLENNDNKPVTNSRDTQEVPSLQGKEVLRLIHNYEHSTSIFDDFSHYEKRQEEENIRKPSRR